MNTDEQLARQQLEDTERANAQMLEEIKTLNAELALLEEICWFYTRDEDRFIKEEGEPYGSIPTDCGMKARSAARRFVNRERAALKGTSNG